MPLYVEKRLTREITLTLRLDISHLIIEIIVILWLKLSEDKLHVRINRWKST